MMQNVIRGLVVSIFLSSSGYGQGVQVVRRLNGYQCMALNLSTAAQQSFENLPPVLANPSPAAAQVGIASASVIVATPLKAVNGFYQVLHLNGQSGWIEASKLRPWVNANSPSTQCFPAMMSNGKPGFDYAQSH
jgi:hypothetical protein